MKGNILILYFLIFLKINNIVGRSEEFYKCINLENEILSSTDCTNIKIPESEGYKCCSMKITFNNDSSYSCLTIETKYTINKETLNEYISKNNIGFLFTSVGGQMNIECGEDLKIQEDYKKVSGQYLNCYYNHIKGIENENDCTKNDIPYEEGSKCCFVETSAENNNGSIINDKRCYMIPDEYFTKDKNLSNYILEESNTNNLGEIGNTNVTINCKNYAPYYFSVYRKANGNIPIDPSLQQKESGLKTWAIILIILGCIIFVGIGVFLIVFFYCRKSRKTLETNKKSDIVEINTQ